MRRSAVVDMQWDTRLGIAPIEQPTLRWQSGPSPISDSPAASRYNRRCFLCLTVLMPEPYVVGDLVPTGYGGHATVVGVDHVAATVTVRWAGCPQTNRIGDKFPATQRLRPAQRVLFVCNSRSRAQ